MEDERAGKGLESRTKRDRAWTIVTVGQPDRVLPAAQRIVGSQLGAIDVSYEKRIDVDVERVDPTRVVFNRPLFLGTKWKEVERGA